MLHLSSPEYQKELEESLMYYKKKQELHVMHHGMERRSDKEEKRVQSVPNNVRPGVMPKRSYSFSDGNSRIFRKYLSVP